MFRSSRFLPFAFGFASRCRPLWSSVRKTSSLPLSSPVIKTKELPDGISLEVLNDTHINNISQLRKLLVDAFVLNNEPVVQALCQRHYPTLSTNEQLLEVERMFKKLHSDQSLVDKINEGLSIAAVKDEDPKRYVSVFFSEAYKGDIYKKGSVFKDKFCQDGLDLMHAVHQKAAPFLSCYAPEKIVFMSHGATCPEYRSTGIMEACLEAGYSLVTKKGFELTFSITSTERLANFAKKRFQYHAIAEVVYKDYELNGQKVFANLVEDDASAKALVKFL